MIPEKYCDGEEKPRAFGIDMLGENSKCRKRREGFDQEEQRITQDRMKKGNEGERGGWRRWTKERQKQEGEKEKGKGVLEA